MISRAKNKSKFQPGADSAIKHREPTTENTGETDAERESDRASRREPVNEGWAFDGVSS